MDAFTFTEHLIGHLAWPVAGIVVSIIFHRELRNVFTRAKLLKFAGVEVSLEEQVRRAGRGRRSGRDHQNILE